MSHPTCNHDSRRVFTMMRWSLPAVTFVLSAVVDAAILTEPTHSGSIRGVSLPKKKSTLFLPNEDRNNVRRLEVVEDDDCQPTYSKNDLHVNQNRGTTTTSGTTSNCTKTTNTNTKFNGCDQATLMPDDGTLIVMNTTNALRLGPQCNSNYMGKGYWFEIIGKGRHVAISTCHQETSIPTVISAYQSSQGGCGSQLSCVALITTTTNSCRPLRFLAETDITYKISVLANSGNTTSLAEPPTDAIIALSITREIICPCWSASELLSATPITHEYLAQSCNTILNTNDDLVGDLAFDATNNTSASTSTSIFILDTMDQGAQISRIESLNHSRIECSIQGLLIRRTIDDVTLDDEVETCLGLLHDRCTELSWEGAIWSMFQEACSPDHFVNTILLPSDDDGDIDNQATMMADYIDCLKVGTNVPTPLPSRKPDDDHQQDQPQP